MFTKKIWLFYNITFIPETSNDMCNFEMYVWYTAKENEYPIHESFYVINQDRKMLHLLVIFICFLFSEAPKPTTTPKPRPPTATEKTGAATSCK